MEWFYSFPAIDERRGGTGVAVPSDDEFSAVLQVESKRSLVSLKIGKGQLEDLIYCCWEVTIITTSWVSQQSWTAVHWLQCNGFLGVRGPCV